MRVQLRILSSQRDPKEIAALAGAGFGRGAMSRRVRAETEAPRIVNTRELELTLDDVRQMILERMVKSTDLINTGSGWQTLADCPELDDDVFPLVQRERQIQALKVLGGALLLVTAFFLYMWLRL